MDHLTALLLKGLRRLSRHDMKSIIAETERNASSRTPPKDGPLTVKWTPRTPPRPERMAPVPGLPMSSSTSKKVDLRTTAAITPGLPTVAKPGTPSSGLSITRPRDVGPVLAAEKQQSRSPPKPLVLKPSAHPLTRTQSDQVFQPITPLKSSASSPSIRRTSLVSSFDRPSLILILIVLGVGASHGQTCPTAHPPVGSRLKVV